MGKVHMDKFKAAVESLKKTVAAKDEQEMFRLFSENRVSVNNEQLRQDAGKICSVLQKKYPSTNVGFLIKEAL